MATVGAVSNNPASPFYNANVSNLTGAVGSLLTILDQVLVNGVTGFSALGWTKPFANSGNLGCYKNSGAGSTGYCLAVNDNAPSTAKEARVTGFASMSSVSAGSGQFPTAAQSTIGTGQLVWRKSTTADSTARYWTIVGDSTCFYLYVETGDQTAPFCAYPAMFGDFFTYGASDTNNCTIIGRTIENSAIWGAGGGSFNNQNLLVENFSSLNLINSTVMANTLNGHFVAASFTNTGGSVPVGKLAANQAMLAVNGFASWQMMGFQGVSSLQGSAGGFGLWVNNFNYPNAPDGGLYACPVFIVHNGIIRGYYKGLWCPLQHMPLNHDDTYSGTGNLSGKSFLAQNILGGYLSSNSAFIIASQVHQETTSGGWT